MVVLLSIPLPHSLTTPHPKSTRLKPVHAWILVIHATLYRSEK